MLKHQHKKKMQEQPVKLICPSCKGEFLNWAVHDGCECEDCAAERYVAAKAEPKRPFIP